MHEYRLFLDDIRNVKDIYPEANLDEWVVVRSFEKFKNHIEVNGVPVMASFDHDLGLNHYNPEIKDSREKTGLDCARWLIDYCFDNKIKLPRYKVHSFNPVGKLNIEHALKDYEKHENYF